MTYVRATSLRGRFPFDSGQLLYAAIAQLVEQEA